MKFHIDFKFYRKSAIVKRRKLASIENIYKSEENDEMQLPVHDIYDEYRHKLLFGGKIVSIKDEIFTELSQKMKRTKEAVYLAMKRVHSAKIGSTTEIVDAENVVVPRNDALRSKSAFDNSDDNNGNSDTASVDAIVKESYSEVFENAGIFETEYRSEKMRDKKITKLCVKSGWTSKLAVLLYTKFGISCKFDLKKAWVVNGTVSSKGTCVCGGGLVVSSDLKVLRVNITNIDKDFAHTRKYSQKGALKEKSSHLLQHHTAEFTRMKLVNEINPDNKNLNEIFDPLTPGNNALRIQKYKQGKCEGDPIKVLMDMKANAFKNVIIAVGMSPFYVFYQTELQLAWYKTESKRGPISISIDATGSVVIPPQLSQEIQGRDKLKHIFLYSIVVETATKSVPVIQMLSQDNSSEFIEFFLHKMFKEIKAPYQIVCDESKALLKALAAAFAKFYSINDYVKACMSALINGTPAPLCFLRIDRSHFVKNVTRKIKEKDYRRKQFYQGVVGYLIQCESFETVKKILLDFFTVLLNKFDGSIDSIPTAAEESKRRLLRLITTHSEEADYVDAEMKLDDTELNTNVDCDWINQIIEQVGISDGDDETSHANLYYSPSDKDFYVRLFSTISLWSNVMNSSFGCTTTVATSSDIESSFKSLKHGITRGKMVRVDSFLPIHIEYVNAEVKLNASSSANSKHTNSSSIQMRKRSSSLHKTSPSAIRKRSNSNQYEYYETEQKEEENGKCLELYDLVKTLY